MSKLDQVHKALQKKANRELSEQFIREIEEKVRQMAYEDAKAEALAHWEQKIGRGLARQMELVMLLKLHDLWGYGFQRGATTIVGFEELWGDVSDKRLSLEDIEETVKAEMKLVVEDDGVYKVNKDGTLTKLYPKEEE